MRSSHSPTIRSRYDYYYSSMSPASTAANFYDNQNQSLFGDPVPPSTDFLETLDNHLYGSLRRSSSVAPNTASDVFIDDFLAAQNRLRIVPAGGHGSRIHTSTTTPPMVSSFDAISRYEYDAYNPNRRPSSSSYSDELRANANEVFRSETDVLIPTAPKRLFSSEPVSYRNLSSIRSNDSAKFTDSQTSSNNEWIRPNNDNNHWKGYPRPASRNIMHIDHGSSIATTALPESMTSSSDENKSASLYGAGLVSAKLRRTIKSAAPVPTPSIRPPTDGSSSDDFNETHKTESNPTIFTEVIHTGSDYRHQSSRPHKRASFTIINELSPNQSRPPSPTGGRTSPFRGKGFRANMRQMRPVSCPDSPRSSMAAGTQDNSSRDDSMVPSKPSVHFNIVPPVPRKRGAIKVLQAPHDIDSMASADQYEPAVIDVSYHDRDMESFELFSDEQRRSDNSNRRGSIRAIYPELPRMSLKPSPAPRRHIHKSLNDLDDETSTDNDLMLSAPAINPRSYHKGLLRVVSSSGGNGGGSGSANVSPSKIPRRKSSISISSSMDHLSRRYSVSPHRKKSVDMGGSMHDLGRTPSRSSSRISKPTTLSPIIGTPNKDCQQDDDTLTSDLSSPTKIPIRRNSNVNLSTRLSSRSNSRSGSRDPSPMKGLGGSSNRSSPSKLPQKPNAKLSPTKVDRTTRGKKAVSDEKTIGSNRGATKEASSVRKESAINRERSSVKKPPAAAIKREPSTLKRQPSNLKRETSTLKRTPSNLKRENSTLANRKTPQSTLHKNQSDSSLSKRIDANSFKNRRRTSSESDGLNELATANTSDNLIPINASSTVSMRTAAIASQPAQITAAVTNQLNKSSSTSQILVNNSNDNNNLISNTNTNSTTNVSDVDSEKKSSTNLSTNNVATISVNDGSNVSVTGATGATGGSTTFTTTTDAQKLLETGSKMVDDVTTAMDKTAGGGGETATMTTTTPGQLMKKASSRTLGAKSDIGSMSGLSVTNDAGRMMLNVDGGEPHANTTSAIETNVNVIDMTGSGHHSNNTIGSDTETMLRPANDIDDHRSERTGNSMGPDVAVEDMNSANRQTNKLGQANNDIGAYINPSTGVKTEMSDNAEGESDESATCCKLCKCCTSCYASALCLPCRRLKKLSCCGRRGKQPKFDADEKQAAAVATILNETEAKTESCWKRLRWCKRNKQKQMMDEAMSIEQQAKTLAADATNATKEAAATMMDTNNQKQRSKCTMCLAKYLCCRKTNKIQSTTEPEDEGRTCCFCLPCRRKAEEPMAAWTDNRQDSVMSDTPKKSCCARFCERLMCCKKKEVIESRRTSMNSKKQSIAPTLPPEDTRPKIDESLVDHTSLMKAAIPVLPVSLAWFCLICNCLIPGFGTICSGVFCLCLGIPRFSQYDGVRARIGSFVINTFVGVAQAFTLIFCLVGWGWSIWWGMIMLRASRKHRKLMQADDGDLEEAETIASHSTSNPPVMTQNHRDIEAGRTI